MQKGIVFDLDGTLVDSLPGIALGLNRALESLGFPTHTEQEIRNMVGSGARELCKSALGITDGEPHEREIADLLRAFMVEYANTWENGTIPYGGITELLSAIKRQGVPMAVLSNKPHEITVPLVNRIFPDAGFDMIFGYSSQFPRKPDPSALSHIISQWELPSPSVIMIGDSIHDARTARNAGCGLLLVSWGYGNGKALQDFNVPVCGSVSELTRELAGLIRL